MTAAAGSLVETRVQDRFRDVGGCRDRRPKRGAFDLKGKSAQVTVHAVNAFLDRLADQRRPGMSKMSTAPELSPAPD